MNTKRLLSLLVSVATIATAFAQLSLPTMKVNGKEFRYYQVGDKESIHGVAQKTGMSVEDIVAANPSASTGLTKKQLLLFPVNPVNPMATVPASMSVKAESAQNYTLGAGENLYTVAKKFNASVEGLLNSNIKLTPDQFTEGAKVKVVPNSAMPFYYETANVTFHNHIVQNGETFYSIANQYGTDQHTVVMLNPSVEKLKKGKPIIVPHTSKVRVMGTMATVDIKDLEESYRTRVGDIHFRLVEEQRNSVCNVGIILPFQLNKADAPKQAYLYTDFLKGFMIAMDSVGKQASRKINVKVYDTQHNLNVTDSLLALPEMKELNLIIAPGEPKQLERINAFGKENDIKVLNCFSTKSEDYKTNPNILLVNTPTPILVKNLTDWVTTRFAGCEVVYLEDASSEASEMYNLIKDNLAAASVKSLTLKVDGDLSADRVSRVLNPGTNYLFIPSNGSKGLLKKIVAPLKATKDERFDCEMNLLGYPEYILHLKDYQENLMAIDTYMFSRFFNAKGFRTRNVEASYSKWYGGSMLESYPHMGLFGFDTGVYVIKTLGAGEEINESTELNKGIQTGFKFNHTDDSMGLINQAITLVHFSPDKKIESFVATDK